MFSDKKDGTKKRTQKEQYQNDEVYKAFEQATNENSTTVVSKPGEKKKKKGNTKEDKKNSLSNQLKKYLK